MCATHTVFASDRPELAGSRIAVSPGEFEEPLRRVLGLQDPDLARSRRVKDDVLFPHLLQYRRMLGSGIDAFECPDRQGDVLIRHNVESGTQDSPADGVLERHTILFAAVYRLFHRRSFP